MQITEAELDIMKAVWAAPESGAAELHAALAPETGWSIKTVKTLLARLVEKGALTTRQDGRRFLYTAAIDQADYQARATRAFVDKLFAGRAAPLVAHLADTKGLTPDDIAELESLLNKLKD